MDSSERLPLPLYFTLLELEKLANRTVTPLGGEFFIAIADIVEIRFTFDELVERDLITPTHKKRIFEGQYNYPEYSYVLTMKALEILRDPAAFVEVPPSPFIDREG